MLLQTSYTMRLKILRKSAYKLLYYSHLLMIHCNIRHSRHLANAFFKVFNYKNIYFFYNSISFLVHIVLCVSIYVFFVPYMDSESEDSLRHQCRHVSSETVFISHIFDQNENGITHPRIIILE